MILETKRGNVASIARVSDPFRAYSQNAQDTFAGRDVTSDNALGLVAVFGAVRLVSNICGIMPLEVIDTTANAARRVVQSGYLPLMLRHRPNEDMSGVTLWTLVFAHLMLRGNAYLAKFRNPDGIVTQLYPVDPRYVHPFRGSQGQKLFRVAIYDGTSMVDHVYDSESILHIVGPGFSDGLEGASPIAVVRNQIGTHLAQGEYQARTYQDGMLVKGALSVPGSLTPEAADQIKRQWRMAYGGIANSNEIAVLHSGAKFDQVSMSPEDAQFIETRRWGHTEIATMYNIPASYLNGEGASMTYENRADNAIQLHQDACLPSIRQVEAALNMDADLFGFSSPWVPRFNAKERLRPDQTARGAWYVQGRQHGWLSINDIRLDEDMDPIPDGDVYAPLAAQKVAPVVEDDVEDSDV